MRFEAYAPKALRTNIFISSPFPFQKLIFVGVFPCLGQALESSLAIMSPSSHKSLKYTPDIPHCLLYYRKLLNLTHLN